MVVLPFECGSSFLRDFAGFGLSGDFRASGRLVAAWVQIVVPCGEFAG
jgi:hypothetical protein